MEQPGGGGGGGVDGGGDARDAAAHHQRSSQRPRRLRKPSAPPLDWKALYKEVFQYDLPLLPSQSGLFKCLSPENYHSSNPWKDSFLQLIGGLHVRPGYSKTEVGGFKIKIFKTIHDALNFAKNNVKNCKMLGYDALIFVHAGTHQGEVVIDSNVALLGASLGKDNTTVILEGGKDRAVKFVMGAETAYLGFLTLDFKPKPTFQEPRSVCVEITSCSPTIQGCIIRNNSTETTAVRVSGKDAKPLITQCEITGTKNIGIVVKNHAQGTYQYNKIINSNRYKRFQTGIWVKDKANPIVSKNIISGHRFGIKVSDEACGIFDKNKVVNNILAAFEVTKEANPSVLQNTLDSGEIAAIILDNAGFGVYLENEVNARLADGIMCSNGSNPTIKLNRIHNSTVGVNIIANGRGWIQHNNIFESTVAGVSIMNSNPIIQENKIHKNQDGIQVDNGRGFIEQNKIYSNSLDGIRIGTSSTTVLQRNRIYDAMIGVHYQDESCGVMKYNIISNNKYNVKIESGSNPVIRKNKIRNGEHGGVSITNRGLGFLEENDIFQNSVAGVHINDFSDPVLKANKIRDSKGCGLSIVNNARGKLEENKIFRNSQSGVLISSGSNPILRKNEISYGLGAGIDITSDASATLECNYITCNKFSGVSIAGGVEAILKENIMKYNGELVEKAVAKGKCLHSISSPASELVHDIYTCETCTVRENNAVCSSVCASCARTCHEDHAVSYVRRDVFRCECGAGELRTPCRAHHPGKPQPPKANERRNAI